jgi:hypothetical protein
MAKAYRTVSFEASCLLAGVPPIGIVIEKRARLYKIMYNTEQGKYECEHPHTSQGMASSRYETDLYGTTRINAVLQGYIY